jgi:hypothetical protein
MLPEGALSPDNSALRKAMVWSGTVIGKNEHRREHEHYERVL